MPADMLKARLAIDELGHRISAVGPDDDLDVSVAQLKDLCDTFAWLDESRTGVIAERDELQAKLTELQRVYELLKQEAHE